MQGKRERLAHLLDRAGLWKAMMWARSRAQLPWLTVLTYHRVADPGGDELFDADVIDATPEQFDAQLAFLTEHFSIVGIEELCAFADGAPLPPNPVAITFDDGYLDNHDVVLPLLERHGARAIFFIATDYTERRRLFWWDRISYLVGRSDREGVSMTVPFEIDLRLGDHAPAAIGELLRIVKTYFGLDIDAFFADLERATGVELPPAEERILANKLIMTWDQVAALDRAGMDVQSHTRTHRVLGTLTAEQLESELAGSREDLARHVEQEVRAVAYPVGYSVMGEQRVCDAIAAAGYQIGFTNQTGVNRVRGGIERFDISRTAMDVSISAEMFRGMMALPYLGRTRS